MRESTQYAVAGTGLLIAGFGMLLSAYSVATSAGLGWLAIDVPIATLFMILGARWVQRYRSLARSEPRIGPTATK